MSKTATSSPIPSSDSSKPPLSPPPSSSIYVRVQRGDPGHGEIFSDWYILDKDTQSLLFSREPEPDKHMFSKSTILGSKVYVLGGMEIPKTTGCGIPSADVFYFDAHQRDQGWKRGPSMLNPRLNPYVTVMDNKIYVFGGSLDDEQSTWGEFFDPESEKWSPLYSDIPPIVSGHTRLNNICLLHTPDTQQLCFFDLAKRTSGVFHGGHKFGVFWGQFVLLEGIMYFARTKLFAYDVNTREWCEGVEGLEQKSLFPKASDSWSFPPSLYHLGNGRICLVWAGDPHYIGNGMCSKLDVHLISFGITKQNRGQQQILVAHSLRHSIYPVEGTSLLDCIACFPFEENKSQNNIGDHKNSNNSEKKKKRKKNKKKKHNNTPPSRSN